MENMLRCFSNTRIAMTVFLNPILSLLIIKTRMKTHAVYIHGTLAIGKPQMLSMCHHNEKLDPQFGDPVLLFSSYFESAYGKLNVLTRKTAIWARVTGEPGQ
jgi:hypothetical protein